MRAAILAALGTSHAITSQLAVYAGVELNSTTFPPLTYLARKTYSPSGAPISTEQLTPLLNGIGYLSFSPNLTTIVFASAVTTMEGDVQTFSLDLASAGAQPVLLFADPASQEALLAPCKPTCIETSTFHARFSPSGDIFFMYTAWDVDGESVGSQALAVAFTNGTVRPLTWVPDASVFDECATPMLDPSRVLFARSVNQGLSTFLALADSWSGNVTVLSSLPALGTSSGCPALLSSLTDILYMGCSDPQCGWTAPPQRAPRRRGGAHALRRSTAEPLLAPIVNNDFFYATIDLTAGIAPEALNATRLWDVPLTKTPSTVDSYAITQCDIIYASSSHSDTSPFFSCQGSDPHDNLFSRLVVSPANGSTIVDTRDELFCMTPHCSIVIAV